MRIDLGSPVAGRRSWAVKNISELARQAHAAHEDTGGYSMAHAVYLASSAVNATPNAAVQTSLTRHLAIDTARQAALTALATAPHGAAIGQILSTFIIAIAWTVPAVGRAEGRALARGR